MKERAEAVLTAGEQQLAERCRQYERQLQAQADQLANFKALIEAQREEIQRLKDTIAVLKGQKGRPKIKPSQLEKGKPGSTQKGGGTGSEQKRAGSAKRAKMAHLTIDQTEIIRPEQVPPGAVFKGYQDYTVQELEIQVHTTRYRCERWQTPDGAYAIGRLPEALRGSHFGPRLRSYILYRYYQQHVTQPLIVEHLGELSIDISVGQVNRILTEGKEAFHEEKEAILRTGLAVAPYVSVDDTEARHRGQNGYCTYIGNEFFTWFASTESKSRRNFLALLRAGHTDYVLNEAAREYMVQQKLPKAQRQLLAEEGTFADQAHWEAHLQRLGIITARHSQIATEGALLGSALSHELPPELVILSDDAGQFSVLCHALCWVHAERTIHKLLPFSAEQREAVETVRGQIWDFYQALKAYKQAPSPHQKVRLEARFDEISTTKTCFQSLNLALKRLHQNKGELLLVLDRPEVPLHNNGSEREIREYVKKRKISASTRSEAGRQVRDTFMSLKKTCRKLGLSFWHYLQDRLIGAQQIPPLPKLIHSAAQDLMTFDKQVR
jgi:Transposase IS66 family